jgi:hypothetical protein
MLALRHELARPRQVGRSRVGGACKRHAREESERSS